MSRPMMGRSGPPGLGRQQATAKADREQIRRLVTSQPKIPKPAPAGAAIIGCAQVDAASSSIIDGGVAMQYNALAYTISDPYAGTTFDQPDLSTWIAVDVYDLSLAAGAYIPVVTIDFAWDAADTSAPTTFQPLMFAGDDMPHQVGEIIPAVVYNGRKGIQRALNYGPTWIDAGFLFGGTADRFGNYRYMRFECAWDSSGSGGPVPMNMRSYGGARLSWTIYRLA